MAIAFFFPSMYADLLHEDMKAKLPPGDLDSGEFDKEQFPHWTVFLAVHLGQAFDDNTILHNSQIIANIPDDKIKLIKTEQLEALGVITRGSDHWD